jgi:hypothetical protein
MSVAWPVKVKRNLEMVKLRQDGYNFSEIAAAYKIDPLTATECIKNMVEAFLPAVRRFEEGMTIHEIVADMMRGLPDHCGNNFQPVYARTYNNVESYKHYVATDPEHAKAFNKLIMSANKQYHPSLYGHKGAQR